MQRTPRLVAAAAVVSLGTIAALFVASSAVGRSQPRRRTPKPTITYVYPIQVGRSSPAIRIVAKADRFTFQWLRCNDNGESCKKIGNATGTTYTVVNADQGHTPARRHRKERRRHTTAGRTQRPGPEEAGRAVELSPPTISGQAVVGETDRDDGKVEGRPADLYTFKWQSCTRTSAPAPRTARAVTPTTSRSRHRSACGWVIAKNNTGQTAALSDPTAKVTEAAAVRRRRQLRAGEPLVAGDRLIVDTVHFSPNPVTSRSTPIKVQITVKDNKGKPSGTSSDGLDAGRDLVARRPDGLERPWRTRSSPRATSDQERLQRAVLRQGLQGRRPHARRSLRSPPRAGRDAGRSSASFGPAGLGRPKLD
jgi:hypothetical protein